MAAGTPTPVYYPCTKFGLNMYIHDRDISPELQNGDGFTNVLCLKKGAALL